MPSESDLNFKREVEETMNAFPGANRGQRFARAVLEFAFGLSREQAVNANANDGALDRGLDASYNDEDYFYLMQFKHHDDPFGQSIGFSASGPGHQLVHCWPYVSDLHHASGELAASRVRRELYDAAVEFNDHVTIKGKRVKMVVVEWADGDRANAAASCETWRQSLPLGHPVEAFEIENFYSIKERWNERKVPISRYQGSAPVKFARSEGLIIRAAPHKALVVHVPGQELVTLFRTVGEALFDPNVRFDLRKTKFNIKIAETARNDPPSFWYYNNGITVLCDDFRIEEPDTVHLDKPGVVNGGQTIKQLYNAGLLADDLLVLVKVIKSQDQAFDSAVALYTNSQNPITLRDLVSNRPEQVRYETEFRSLPVPWFYERKKGAWEILPTAQRALYQAAGTGRGRRPERRLSNEFVGKSTLAFSLQQPVIAKTDTPAIWTLRPNGYYDEIFLKDRDVYELAVATLVNWVLESQRAAFVPPAGTGAIEEVKDCIPHLTALVGLLVQEKYGGTPLRSDLQRLFGDLMDTVSKNVSTSSFVTRLFSTILWPFAVWYNGSRRAADSHWESTTWYKDRGKWNQPGDPTTMITAFALYRGFTPAAQPSATAAIIP